MYLIKSLEVVLQQSTQSRMSKIGKTPKSGHLLVPISDVLKRSKSEHFSSDFGRLTSLNHFGYKKFIYIKQSSLVSQVGLLGFQIVRNWNVLVLILDVV